MTTLATLGKEIENGKKDVDLPTGDLEILQGLTPNDKNKIQMNKQINSLFNVNDDAEIEFAKNPSWLLRARLDALQLDQRVVVCEEIKSTVFDALSKLTEGIKCQEKRIAPIKGIIRALVKLTEYIDEKVKAGKGIKTSV